jgi:glycosyltransferase involved in cell wall biosynthesis
MAMVDVRLLELRNTYKWGGGPDKTILLSAEQHDKSRVTPVVAYIRDVRDREFQITHKARAKGLTYYEIPERGKFDLMILRVLRDIVLRHKINVIHSHDYKSDVFAYLFGRWMCPHPIRLLSTAHAWVLLGLKGELYRRLDLAVMRRLDHLIAVSHATKAEMVAGGVPAERITVIHNAIDTKAWSPHQESDSFRRELGLGENFPVVGYVGRINREKDLSTWLKAFAVMARNYPAARGILVGDGRGDDAQAELERLARELGIERQVMFPGYRSDLQAVYGAFDVFMLSSRREGLPNCILEAMAMGLPVVTTDVAGAKELVKDGETGYVLPLGDADGLAAALLRIIEDPVLRIRLRQAGRRRIESEFSFSNRLRRVEDLYAALVATLPQPGRFKGYGRTVKAVDGEA